MNSKVYWNRPLIVGAIFLRIGRGTEKLTEAAINGILTYMRKNRGYRLPELATLLLLT